MQMSGLLGADRCRLRRFDLVCSFLIKGRFHWQELWLGRIRAAVGFVQTPHSFCASDASLVDVTADHTDLDPNDWGFMSDQLCWDNFLELFKHPSQTVIGTTKRENISTKVLGEHFSMNQWTSVVPLIYPWFPSCGSRWSYGTATDSSGPFCVCMVCLISAL